MDNFDDRLNKILQDPEALAKVAELAKGFGAAAPAVNNPPPPAAQNFANAPPPPPQPPPGGGSLDPGILSALGNLDAKTLSGIAGLLGNLTGKDDRRAGLLAALKPYLRAERQSKIDRAMQLLQLSKVAKGALGMFGGTQS